MRAPTLTFKRARRLRREMTLPEVILWQRLRRGQLNGLQFRRQHPIGPYVLDFYQPQAKLAVEVDGMAHDIPDQAAHDERRTTWLREHEVAVLRVPASEALRGEEGLENVLSTIAAAVAPSTAFGGPPPPLRG